MLTAVLLLAIAGLALAAVLACSEPDFPRLKPDDVADPASRLTQAQRFERAAHLTPARAPEPGPLPLDTRPLDSHRNTAADGSYLDLAGQVLLRLAMRTGLTLPFDWLDRRWSLVAWFRSEEPAGHWPVFHPANSGFRENCAGPIFVASLLSYDSFDCGVHGTVDTLLGYNDQPIARYGYDAIVDALLNERAGWPELRRALIASSWCECLGDEYEHALPRAIDQDGLAAFAHALVPTQTNYVGP